MIDHWHRYTREQIRANPETLFVFGDNLAGAGYGGQAKEARGEPNAVGIVTKRKPTMEPDAFLSDDDLDEVKPLISAAFRRLASHIEAGGNVVFPADGIGTGLALLHEKAPLVQAHIDNCYKHLMRLHYRVTRPFQGANIPAV